MRKIRINIFEDDPTNLRLFEAIMSTRDYEVYASERAVPCPIYMNPAEECSSLKPCADIILTDNMMPGMSGIEMLQQQARRGCRIDVRNKAVASADFDERHRQAIAMLGCAAFTKPFHVHELFAWLDDCERRIDRSTPLGVVRKGDRLPATFEMEYATAAGEQSHRGTALNYSEGGLCLRTDVPLGEEQSIVINSDLPNGCRLASVRWVNKGEGESYLAGLSCR